jgi:hypothetical protein
MSKKLDITSITNELEESAFFSSRKQHVSSPTPLPIVKEKQVLEVITATQPKPQIPERANAPSPERPNGKRIITRNSFEIYEDQMDSLRKLSYQEKMDGKLGSMSGMVREAIDSYLLKRTPPK